MKEGRTQCHWITQRIPQIILILILLVFTTTSVFQKFQEIRLPSPSSSNSFDTVTAVIEGWPKYEDEYFNIKFQYPPDWRVEKVDVTNYYDESGLDLMGEDAALAGPLKHKTWVIRIVPPYEDVQEINRGNLSTVRSAIVIEQPNRFHGNNHFYSDVFRPRNREYESVLDPYGENFRFNFTSHASFGNGLATTSMSLGHSPDGVISGSTAVKFLPHGYHFQSHMTMTSKLGHNENNIFAFVGVVSSMQLLFPERLYDEENYKIQVLPAEYKAPSD